jgi:hypothetical protein
MRRMMKKYVVSFAVVLAVVACTKSDTLTGPSVQDPAVSTAGGQTATLEDATQPAATPAGSASAKVWAHGNVDVTGPWDGLICYFWNGPHEQDKAHADVAVSVAAGQTATYVFPDIKQDSPEHCEVQVDVGTSCDRSSIIPGMLAHNYVKVGECPDVCEEEWVTEPSEPEWGDWSNCAEEHQLPPGDIEGCYRVKEGSQTFTEREVCSGETRTAIADLFEAEACACSNECEPEEWVTVEVTEGEAVWGECKPMEVGPLTVAPDGCVKNGKQTFYLKQFNGCEYRTIEEVRDVREKCECPVPPLCYYRVSCGEQEVTSSTQSCTHQQQQAICERTIGLGTLVPGVWMNFGAANLQNHCRFHVPGVINRDFQLTPGQSHDLCLNKND